MLEIIVSLSTNHNVSLPCKQSPHSTGTNSAATASAAKIWFCASASAPRIVASVGPYGVGLGAWPDNHPANSGGLRTRHRIRHPSRPVGVRIYDNWRQSASAHMCCPGAHCRENPIRNARDSINAGFIVESSPSWDCRCLRADGLNLAALPKVLAAAQPTIPLGLDASDAGSCMPCSECKARLGLTCLHGQ